MRTPLRPPPSVPQESAVAGKMETRRYPGTVLAFSEENGMLVRFDGYDDDDEEAEVHPH